jgi:glutamate/aspartate transport system substrate-binding protein
VAFAVTTYVSEVRMAVRADSPMTSFKQLDGKTVAASAGTTAVQLLRKYSHENNVELPTVLGKDHFELSDAGVGPRRRLCARRQPAGRRDRQLQGPQGYKIVGEALGSEPIALLFRKDDPASRRPWTMPCAR